MTTSLTAIGRFLVIALATVLTPSRVVIAAPFDHSLLDGVLRASVRGGRVNYAKIRTSAQFKNYMSLIGSASTAGMGNDDVLAFWINAYNACVIQNVLNHPGINKPTDVKGFFDGAKFTVAGRNLTLNDIENTVIRPTFKNPLVHFGLVCAAVNCPEILPSAYKGTTVRAALASNARRYLASRYNVYDNTSKTLSLSKIFEWYAADFGGEAGVLKFVSTYGTPAMKTGIGSGTPRVRYLEYDWTLNGQ